MSTFKNIPRYFWFGFDLIELQNSLSELTNDMLRVIPNQKTAANASS